MNAVIVEQSLTVSLELSKEERTALGRVISLGYYVFGRDSLEWRLSHTLTNDIFDFDSPLEYKGLLRAEQFRVIAKQLEYREWE